MMFTKTQIAIMKMLVSEITGGFSIRQISEILKKPYPLVHRSIEYLIDKRFILKDGHNLSLNYKENHSELSYIECLRKNEFLKKDKVVYLFAKDAMEKINLDYFTMLIFGSCAKGKKKPRDIDILLIVEDDTKTVNTEKVMHNVASGFTPKFDINVIPSESAYEMLGKRDEANVMNETLGCHVILFGAENYYRLLKNARR